jgi:hypothetical protein
MPVTAGPGSVPDTNQLLTSPAASHWGFGQPFLAFLSFLAFLAGQVHSAHQGELDQVRAGQAFIQLVPGNSQPAAGIVGDQEQQVLGEQHPSTLPRGQHVWL